MKMQHLSLGLLLLGIIATSAVPSTQVTNTSNQPTPFLIYGEVFYENNTQVDAPRVVVTNLNTSRELVAENQSGENFYQVITTTSEMHPGDLLLISAEKDGRPVGSVNHTITMNESRAGALIVDINRGLTDLRVIGIFPPQCIFNGRNNTVNATIANNGTTPAGGFNVSLAVNGDLFERARIESLNTGCTENLTFNWTPEEAGSHTLTVTADSDGEIDESDEMNNATSVSVLVGVPDFTVLDVTLDQVEPVIGDTVTINATVANLGVRADTTAVEFYDTGSLDITRTYEEWEEIGFSSSMYDTLKIPGAIKVRVHFRDIEPYSYIRIYDNNELKVGEIRPKQDVTDYWTDWVPGDTLRMEEVFAIFTIDRYQALVANETISLDAGNIQTVIASYRNVTQGLHNLSVAIDPRDAIPEYDESNNSLAAPRVIDVCGVDLAVMDITTTPDEWYVGDIVTVNATIENIGEADADNFTVIFKYGAYNRSHVEFYNTSISLPPNTSTTVPAPWNLTGIADGYYDLTVSTSSDKTPYSRHWPRIDMDETNNIEKISDHVYPQWDFSVEKVSARPQNVREGDSVDITATIGNHGHASGNVSVGFYIDMWDYILGSGVAPLAYHDCLGAARGWSRDNVSNATGRYIRIGSIDDVHVMVGEETNITLPWDAFTATGNHTIMVVADPDELLPETSDTHIDEELFENNNGTCLLNITPPDISVTNFSLQMYADVGDMVNTTAVVRNNGNEQANSTLWWVVEGDKSHTKTLPGASDSDEWLITQPQHGVLMMRVHFSYVNTYYAASSTHNWMAGVDVVDVNGQNLYSQSCDRESGELNKTNIWTKWGSGDTLIIKPYSKEYGGVICVIDKYQVVIGNETITLNADGYGSYNAIWNATVKPGVYTVWADVEDQNESGTIILNGTELLLNVSLNETYLDGDLVNITAIITNTGTKDATDFTIRFSDRYDPGHGLCPRSTLDNTTYIQGLAAGASVSVPVPWNASVRNIVCNGRYRRCDGGWRDCDWTNEHVHDYTITVEINPLENIEIDETDNHKEIDVHVNPSRDFEVTNISFAVDNEPRDPLHLLAGELVTLNATINITNLASYGGWVDVGFYCDDVLINITRVAFDAGNGTGHAVLDWVVDVGGNHTITVKVDPVYPHDKIVEFNESNNILDQPIYIIAPDLVVTNITFDPEVSEVGDRVNITAVVANIGQKSASNITVRFIDKCRENLFLSTNETISLNISEHRKISVNWNMSEAGEHFISVIIDPENEVPELNESNNELTKSMLVHGADLTVSNLTLTTNGSTIAQIKHGDRVNITAEIANTGVRDAHNISLCFFVDDDQINRTKMDLQRGESASISTTWDTMSATPGNHTIMVAADCDNVISETSESNNNLTEDVHICAAELSGNISWQPAEPLDVDEVIINATITNSGCVPGDNFTVLRFYDQIGELIYSKTDPATTSAPPNESRSYDGAEWVYVQITGTRGITQGDFIVYDGNNTKVASPTEPCWIPVPGDTARVKGKGKNWHGKCMIIHCYAVYPGNLSKIERLDAGSTTNISLVKKVASFNHTITLIVDPENNVPENNETDNTDSDVMHVKPTRDFTVTNVTAAETDLTDTDTTEITAVVANIGFRNGTTNVSFIDYESEGHTYSYWFDERIAEQTLERYCPPYAPVSPPAFDEESLRSIPVRSTIIHRPGVDAIVIDFTYSVSWNEDEGQGEIWVYDGTWKPVWHYHGPGWGDNFGGEIPRVEGETAIIWASGPASYTLQGYTAIHEFSRTEVTLNATERWNESRTLTAMWNASTGDHIITVITDPNDEIGEIDESNNNVSIPIHVNASRDPAVINLTNTPLHPMDGDDVTITAVVRNHGDELCNFTIDLWEDTSKRFRASSPHISVPGASWVNVHFNHLWKLLPDYTCTKIDGVWLDGSLGDTLETGTSRWGGVAVCGVDICPEKKQPGYHWYDQVDRIRHMKLINRTHVTLAPNETRNVTAVWENMRVGDTPEYSVIAIIDPEDEIDEIDESNNEMRREIVMSYPDLVIGHFSPPTERRGARVDIKNTGIGGASDINVSFELGRFEEYESKRSSNGYYSVPFGGCENSSKVRVHFERIAMKDSRGMIQIMDKRRGRVYATYTEDASDLWSPWIERDRVVVNCVHASFRIDGYEWGDLETETIDHLDAAPDHENVEMPEEWGYTEPMNLTVRVDPGDEIPEMDEYNNNETVLLYADLVPDQIVFVSPGEDKLSLDAEKFVIDGYIRNGGFKDGIAFPVSDFNATLEFREPRYPNGTLGKVVFNTTKRVEDPFYAGQKPIRFEFDPSEELKVGGNYTVRLIADSTGNVCESNELYPTGEYNNITSKNIYVYNSSGYTGGGDLIPVADGELHGRVVYTIGDSSVLGLEPGSDGIVKYPDFIPSTADEIEVARLFVYWCTITGERGRYLAELNVRFNNNDHPLRKVGNYSDNPGATKNDWGYGLYSYDVKDYIRRDENVATITNTGDWRTYVHAIGLLVVYEDEDEPLTKYWVNEGADIMMAANAKHPTGLPSGDCITRASFAGVERNDTENVCASLLTVLGMYSNYSRSDLFSNEGDALEFNDRSIGSSIGTGHWVYHYNGSGIALTENQWEDVTDYLKRGDNIATIRSLGNYMMPNNAFLRLILPPDLNVINMTAPEYTPIGIEHSIDATIRNDGRSDAHDFNVRLYIDGMKMVRIPHLDLPAGESMTLHLYNWTPMLPGHVYNLTVEAEVLSCEDWREVETDNNALSQYVIITEGGWGNESGPVGSGGEGERTGGIFTERITGRVMNKIISAALGGGGGAGIFSMWEWILKLGMLALCALTFGVGYWKEQRRHNRRM
ncbi:MAG: CARDB domain-containing protein [Methanosarcinales archaeon]